MARAKKTTAQGMTAQEWADIKFKGEGPEAQRLIGSLQDWLRRAENEYPTIFFATAVIQYDDDHALDMVRTVGPDAAIDFVEALKRFSDSHRAVAHWANAAHLRMLAATSRFEALEAHKEAD